MARFAPFSVGVLVFVAVAAAAVLTGAVVWIVLAVLLGALVAVGVFDLVQRKHSILRNYPLIGHMRFALESLRPELQQYFIERNTDGRAVRPRHAHLDLRAGQGDQGRAGLRHRARRHAAGVRVAAAQHRAGRAAGRAAAGAAIGDYEMSLLNVSAMSFGALSKSALIALNQGAQRGRLRA